MSKQRKIEITETLLKLRENGNGEKPSTNHLAGLLYDELRSLAGRYLRLQRPDHSLQPTALVHEAYLKLVHQDRAQWQDRAHFLAVAAKAMRHILIDHARKRSALKRGGDMHRVTLNTSRLEIANVPRLELLAFDDALSRLSAQDERVGRVAELRVYGGMTARETAIVLGVSERTVFDDWTVARLWLSRELKE
ncbi:ECF-type sigma factor [Candidatus Eisenbacteria bacterium]|uniref:ECF-type sigma factor n=1 Tax=Eiseniibacteriota bacterium TaxID=2212470 RepID=A0ABV6YJL3_UNCEI